MISAKFRYIDRRKKDLLVLVPGWASDYRIFSLLNLEFNYLIPDEFSPFTFEKNLLEVLRKSRIKKISLFGWSLGGFVAAEFAAKYTTLTKDLILVSIRKSYKKRELSELKRRLRRNKNGSLYKFYTRCFFKEEQMRWFKENLFKDYCQQLNLKYLLKSLAYLENSKIKPELLNRIKRIKIIHGTDDSIAPIQEAIDIQRDLTQAKFVEIKETGHLPFLEEGFSRYI